ncbi:MAG: carboxymuconolactone decarboxylase family protein, partial [Pseudomonadota bacterium]
LDAETREMIAFAENLMGFVPNDSLVMARRPALLKAMAGLVGAIYGPGEVDAGLKRLIGEAASKAAGCFYCSAHAAHGAKTHGVSAEKIEAVWSFEDSPLFDYAERAAINLAMKAGVVPNETEDEDFDRLRQHFDEGEIVEIVSVIAMFGFLNLWNSTLLTELEPSPAASVVSFDGTTHST